MNISYEKGHNKTAHAEGFSAGPVESFAAAGMGDCRLNLCMNKEGSVADKPHQNASCAGSKSCSCFPPSSNFFLRPTCSQFFSSILFASFPYLFSFFFPGGPQCSHITFTNYHVVIVVGFIHLHFEVYFGELSPSIFQFLETTENFFLLI